MPKSRRRKRNPQKSVPMTQRVREALLEQRKAFSEKFGRELGPDDPVFFDPAKDTPTPIDPGRMEAELEKALREGDAAIEQVGVSSS